MLHQQYNHVSDSFHTARDVEKQKKARRKVKVDNQCAYTDSNRAMAVCMGDKELSKALKNFEKDVSVEEMNNGVVNSEMYKRQALHYSARKQHEAARKYLESGFQKNSKLYLI